MSLRENESTPRLVRLHPVEELVLECRDLKFHCQRLADNADIRITNLEERVNRLALFRGWFPTVAVTVAIIVQVYWNHR